jgi:methyltransferase
VEISALGVIVYSFMLLEARRAARHERAQRERGGMEPDGDVYRLMRIAYPAAFLAMLVEGSLRGAAAFPAIAIGIGTFAAAKALKWWAIVSLGAAWTFRVIVVPGSRLVESGPYRLMRHPNYVGVLGELVGVALMANAPILGPIVTIGFGWLIARRIGVEARALNGILRPR